MAERLKDLRTSIQNIDQADAEFALLAIAEIEIARINAEAEARIAKIKAEADCQKEEHSAEADRCRAALAAYIESHPDEFAKPRKRKTDWGTYGLHTATKVQVSDKDAAIAHCLADGLTECLKQTITLLTKPIEKLINAGRQIDGCEISSGEIALCTVKKELLDKARKAGAQ